MDNLDQTPIHKHQTTTTFIRTNFLSIFPLPFPSPLQPYPFPCPYAMSHSFLDKEAQSPLPLTLEVVDLISVASVEMIGVSLVLKEDCMLDPPRMMMYRGRDK